MELVEEEDEFQQDGPAMAPRARAPPRQQQQRLHRQQLRHGVRHALPGVSQLLLREGGRGTRPAQAQLQAHAGHYQADVPWQQVPVTQGGRSWGWGWWGGGGGGEEGGVLCPPPTRIFRFWGGLEWVGECVLDWANGPLHPCIEYGRVGLVEEDTPGPFGEPYTHPIRCGAHLPTPPPTHPPTFPRSIWRPLPQPYQGVHRPGVGLVGARATSTRYAQWTERTPVYGGVPSRPPNRPLHLPDWTLLWGAVWPVSTPPPALKGLVACPPAPAGTGVAWFDGGMGSTPVHWSCPITPPPPHPPFPVDLAAPPTAVPGRTPARCRAGGCQGD